MTGKNTYKELEQRIRAELVAVATAEGIRKIAEAIQAPGGENAVNLRVAEQYIKEFGKLAKENNTIIIPSDLSDIAGMVTAATSLLKSPAKPLDIK